jgi:hypothetical protein
MELRNRVRYRLSVAAVFAWEGPRQNKLHGEGLTRDIGVSGVFIFTKTGPPVGATLDLEIFLSSDPKTRPGTVRIRTVATVIRVEHKENCEGFAATSKDFTLLFDRHAKNGFGVSSIDKE